MKQESGEMKKILYINIIVRCISHLCCVSFSNTIMNISTSNRTMYVKCIFYFYIDTIISTEIFNFHIHTHFIEMNSDIWYPFVNHDVHVVLSDVRFDNVDCQYPKFPFPCQQCFFLTPNQHQPIVFFLSHQTSTSQPAVLFSHNKSASATSHSQPNRVLSNMSKCLVFFHN